MGLQRGVGRVAHIDPAERLAYQARAGGDVSAVSVAVGPSSLLEEYAGEEDYLRGETHVEVELVILRRCKV
tara:strand:+ start:282 stop:494 length:213 start_codon:yes stop_codon:yes gene_type:complete